MLKSPHITIKKIRKLCQHVCKLKFIHIKLLIGVSIVVLSNSKIATLLQTEIFNRNFEMSLRNYSNLYKKILKYFDENLEIFDQKS